MLLVKSLRFNWTFKNFYLGTLLINSKSSPELKILNKITRKRSVFIRYFLRFKKKRKIFKFKGLCLKKKGNSMVFYVRLNKEVLLLTFFIFNPFILTLEPFFRKRHILYLYKLMFINFLLDIICFAHSKSKVKNFPSKIRFRFR